MPMETLADVGRLLISEIAASKQDVDMYDVLEGKEMQLQRLSFCFRGRRRRASTLTPFDKIDLRSARWRPLTRSTFSHRYRTGIKRDFNSCMYVCSFDLCDQVLSHNHRHPSTSKRRMTAVEWEIPLFCLSVPQHVARCSFFVYRKESPV
jgi:hypothetical protein